jgi:DNA primase
MLVAVNPRNNLAHCFGCDENLNNIDLLRTLGYSFPEAVALLERWLTEFLTKRRPRVMSNQQ